MAKVPGIYKKREKQPFSRNKNGKRNKITKITKIVSSAEDEHVKHNEGMKDIEASKIKPNGIY